MEFSFVPKNLIKAKEEIISKHAGIGEPIQVANDFDFMKMIKRQSGNKVGMGFHVG